MIYDPIPFIKLVQKILVGNYEPIMRICGKIFTNNLHNLQMLFMLWIKNEFSECLAPPAQTWRSPMEDFLVTVLPRPAYTGGIRGQLPPNLFCAPQILLCSEKFVSNIWQKLKSFPHKKCILPPKPQNGFVSAKIVSAIRIFCFEVYSDRDVA